MEIHWLKPKHHVLGISLLILFILLTLNYFQPILGWDENAYLANGRSLIGQSNYDEIFRFPLITYLISGMWNITGQNVFAIRLAMIFFYLLNIFLFFSILERIKIFKNYNLLLTIIFAFNPLMLSMGFRVNTDVFGLTFVLLALLFFLKAEENKNNKVLNIITCGFFAGMAFLTRYPYGLAFGGLFLFLLFKRAKQSLMLSAGFGIAIIIDTIFRYITGMPNLIESIRQMLHITTAFQMHESILKFIGNSWLCFGLLLIFFFYGIYSWIRKWDEKKQPAILNISLITIILSIIYYGFIVLRKEDRFLIFFIPYVLLFCIYGMIHFPEKIKTIKLNAKKIKILAIVFLILTIIPFAFFTFEKIECDKENPIPSAQDFIRHDTSNTDTIISNIWPYFGYRNNINSISLWAEDMDIMFDQYKPKYVILANYENKIDNNAIPQNTDFKNLKLIQNFKNRCLSIDIYALEFAD